MRRLLTLASFVVVCSALGTAATAAESDVSTKETRAMMHAYAKCVVKRQGKKASEALLANIDNSEILRRYRMLIIGDCLARQVMTTTEMSFGGDLYRYALADALVNAELASQPPMDVAALPALDQRNAGDPPLQVDAKGKKLSKKRYDEALQGYDKSVAYAFLARYGECVARTNIATTKALLLTEPDGAAEAAQFGLLKPAFANCLREGETLKFGKVALRGSLAVNYYRLAHAASAVTQSAAR